MSRIYVIDDELVMNLVIERLEAEGIPFTLVLPGEENRVAIGAATENLGRGGGSWDSEQKNSPATAGTVRGR